MKYVGSYISAKYSSMIQVNIRCRGPSRNCRTSTSLFRSKSVHIFLSLECKWLRDCNYIFSFYEGKYSIPASGSENHFVFKKQTGINQKSLKVYCQDNKYAYKQTRLSCLLTSQLHFNNLLAFAAIL